MKVNEILAEGLGRDAAPKFYEAMKRARYYESQNKDNHTKRELYDAQKHLAGMSDSDKKTHEKDVAEFTKLCAKYGIK